MTHKTPHFPAVLLLLVAVPLAAQSPPAAPVGPPDPTRTALTEAQALDAKRYDGCTRAIDADAAKAEQFAAEWRKIGGGLPARHCEALAQLRQKRFTQAAANLAEAAALAEAAKHPLAGDIRGQAGNAALLAGDAKTAVAHFTSALATTGDLAPRRSAALLVDRARAETELGRTAEARADLDEAVRLAPEDPTAWLLSAALARRAGDLARASFDIGRASGLAPADPDVLLEQGNVALANGDSASAGRLWGMVRRAAPASEAAAIAERAQAALAAAPR